MGNFHRIQWIDSQIRENHFPNTTGLADEFCISVRQAARDFEYLKYSLGAPMEYSAAKRGYYYTENKFTLPGIFLGKDEKEALAFLADRYRSSGGEMTEKLAALFDRISGGNPVPENKTHERGSLPVFGLSKNTAAAGRTIFDAMQAGKKIRIVYQDSHGKESKRTIHPLAVHGQQDAQYLHAYCELRRDERDFRLERIKQAHMTGESFEIPEEFDPGAFGTITHFDFRLPYTATVQIEGEDVRTIRFKKSGKLFMRLMSKGIAFRILAPVWLRERFMKLLSGYLERNK